MTPPPQMMTNQANCLQSIVSQWRVHSHEAQQRGRLRPVNYDRDTFINVTVGVSENAIVKLSLLEQWWILCCGFKSVFVSKY